MMHKNADDYVLDQNVDRISREIAYVPLSGRIRSKRSSCMELFFFFFFGKEKNLSTRHAYQWSDGLILDVLPRGPLKLNFGRASQRSDGLESWTCFPEVQGFEFWTYFPEVQGFEFWTSKLQSILQPILQPVFNLIWRVKG